MKRTALQPGTSTLKRTPFPRTVPFEGGRTPLARTPLSPVSSGRAKSAAGRAGTASGRHESFPPAVAAQIDARDPWCIHCGTPFGLQRHHRRIKGIGGDSRPHTDCACNAVRICLLCHDAAHGAGRLEAEDEGLIIPRATVEPWRLAVLVHLEDDTGGQLKYPSCDGRWLDYVPERGAA